MPGPSFSVGNAGAIDSTGITVGLNIADPLANIVVASHIHTGSGGLSSIKYDGVDMTYVDNYIVSTKGLYLHYLINPPLGAKDCVVAWSASCQQILFVAAFKAVQISGPFGARTKVNGGSGSFTGTVPSVPAGALAIDEIFSDGTAYPSIAGTQTQQAPRQDTGNMRGWACYNSNGVPGDVAFAYSNYGGGYWMGSYLKGLPAGGGSQVIIMGFRRLLDEMKRGLMPPDELQRRWRDLVAI